MENLIQRWTQSGPDFQNQGTFFNFQKRAWEVKGCFTVNFIKFSKTSFVIEWKSKTRVMSYELRVQIHELRVQIHELRVQIHELED